MQHAVPDCIASFSSKPRPAALGLTYLAKQLLVGAPDAALLVVHNALEGFRSNLRLTIEGPLGTQDGARPDRRFRDLNTAFMESLDAPPVTSAIGRSRAQLPIGSNQPQ
jgi:hypothetical protein